MSNIFVFLRGLSFFCIFSIRLQYVSILQFKNARKLDLNFLHTEK